jgi:hypothetical protein
MSILNQVIENTERDQFESKNYQLVIEGFTAKGIPTDQIKPYENVFTYGMWQHKGRQVMKDERGVSVTTVREYIDKSTGQKRKKFGRCRVFHISQTKPIESGIVATTPAKPTKKPVEREVIADDILSLLD